MKHSIPDRWTQLARTYWQPLVLTLLAILAFSQIVAWGVAVVELKKVDNLIAQTEKPETTTTENKSDESEQSGPSGSKPPPNPEQPRKPAKNIFKKEELNYMLSAIYMDKAVINGQEVGIGQNIGKATLKEIGINRVVLEEENGNSRTVDMFQGGEGAGPSSPPNNTPSGSPGSRRSGGNRAVSPSGSPSVPPGGPMGMGNIPANFTFRGMNREQLERMSQEERRNLFQSLSDGEREQLRQQFRQIRGR